MKVSFRVHPLTVSNDSFTMCVLYLLSVGIGMPNTSPKNKQLKLAREKREKFGHIPPPKPAVIPLAPRDHSHPPQSPKRASIPFTPISITPPQPKRRQFSKKMKRKRKRFGLISLRKKLFSLRGSGLLYQDIAGTGGTLIHQFLLRLCGK